MTDNTLHHDAEMMVLGALLNNNEELYNLVPHFNPDCFSDSQHKMLFELILGTIDKNEPASPVTLAHELSLHKDFRDSSSASNFMFDRAILAPLGTVPVKGLSKMLYELYLKRSVVKICQHAISTCYTAGNMTSDVLSTTEQSLYDLHNHNSSDIANMSIVSDIALNTAKAAHIRKSALTGINTGYQRLNNMLGGLQNSDLIIIAARPSMGKTAFAINLAINMAKHDKHVCFFSLEMSVEQLAMRMLAITSEIDLAKIKAGMLNDDAFKKLTDAHRRMSSLNITIDESPSMTSANIRSKVRHIKNIDCIIIDYLQLMHSTKYNNNPNRVLEISDITQSLKLSAKEFNIPIIVLSQLSRAVETRDNKRPLLSDLRDSGSIEQDADIVLFLYRDAYYSSRNNTVSDIDPNLAEILIAKHRNGPIGKLTLNFNERTGLFQ